MSRVRSKDTKPEMLLRRELWGRGLRYRLHVSDLPGKPDLVFKGPKIAVFVDSDWWHGRIIREHGKEELRKHLRGERQDWWVDKLTRNVERDQEVTAELRDRGWEVLRFWTSAIKDDVQEAADQVEEAVLSHRSNPS